MTQPVFSSLEQLPVLSAMSDLHGHNNLAEEVWLSTDPKSNARFMLTPIDGTLRLSLTDGDTARWACLSWREPVARWQKVDRFNLRVHLRSKGFLAYHPTLRHVLKAGGHEDVFSSHPVLCTGGEQVFVSRINIDQKRLDKADHLEVTLFFQCDSFDARFLKIETF